MFRTKTHPQASAISPTTTVNVILFKTRTSLTTTGCSCLNRSQTAKPKATLIRVIFLAAGTQGKSSCKHRLLEMTNCCHARGLCPITHPSLWTCGLNSARKIRRTFGTSLSQDSDPLRVPRAVAATTSRLVRHRLTDSCQRSHLRSRIEFWPGTNLLLTSTSSRARLLL